MNKSILLTKPIKTMPEVLIYKQNNVYRYTMLDVKNSKIAGRMYAHFIQNLKTKECSLFINTLNIYQKRQGFGSKFLDFAKQVSKQFGCEGRVRLIASTTEYDPLNPPHIFYRKNGFSTDNKKLLKKIDKYIKNNKQLPHLSTPPETMYYPPKPEVKMSFVERIKDFFNI